METKNLKNTNVEIIERKAITSTPFELLKTKNGYCLTLGGIPFTKNQKSKEKLLNMLNGIDWNNLCNLMILIAMKVYNNEKTKEKSNEKD